MATRAMTVSRPVVVRRGGTVSRTTYRGMTRRRKKQFTIPLAIVFGFMPAAMDVKNNAASLGWAGSLAHTGAGLIGYDTVSNKYVGWRQASAAGAPAIAVGFGVHVVASKLGLNRMLANAGIPFIRI